MASRNGPVVAGTDGTDFLHREKVAKHYQIRSDWPPKKPFSILALNKGRLRKCIFSHFLLSLLMMTKLVPDLLDRLDVFILEIEELEIPQPHKWEYLWLFGTLSCFLGLLAIQRNRIVLLQVFFGLVNLFSTIPVLFASMFYFSEFWEFCTEKEPKNIQMWQGYPLAALWYVFLMAALQVHVFTLVFAWKLVVAWRGGRGPAAAKKAN